ncbi:hypothetical protein GLW05_21565 [Pontibacillus yanchengensis]|uniref:DUF5683 domain-containing protein n=1 Tax=Pontibacillus yanchengensis TaxID=462910 RepID=A0A6I5A6W7_9BACI|nr:hypothetical protein [Pontibacillus yanchengensis]MYL36150.1 hypothetical protein [Pontibacillus yanchengensis]
MIGDNPKEYKSPIAALLWSVTMSGFGQMYNGQYLFGTLLLLCEFLVNLFSNLNLAIWHSLQGEFQQAHDVIDYKWGLFYPSLYSFSIWQAYNKAILHKHKLQGRTVPQRTYLTGLSIGLVVGMIFGICWHQNMLAFGPVANGLLWGAIGALLGH